MTEQAIEVRTTDGTADGFLYRPERGASGPGVLHLTDILGIRQANRQMAQRLAEQGYTVLLANAFYRSGHGPLFDFPVVMGEERTMRRFSELAGALTPDAAERDAAPFSDFLLEKVREQGVQSRSLAVVGYCFTGAIALCMAAARPEQFAALASFHGGGLYSDSPQSPHRVLPRVAARLYFGHAENDRLIPAEAITKLEAALEAWGPGRYESEIYQGAAHGWTVPGGPAYNEAQADRAFNKLTELLARTLKP
jgi:carboxymethylenebutenolidase